MRHMKLKKLQLDRKKFLAAIVTLVIITSSSWFADALKGECFFGRGCPSIDWPVLAGSAAVYLVSAFLAFYLGRNLFQVNVLNYQKEPEPKSAMIAFVSRMPKMERIDEGHWSITAHGEPYTIGNGLERDIEHLEGSNIPFQQLLRAIRPHKDKLRKIILLHSEQSRDTAEDYKTIIPKYLPNVTIDKQPADFEDLEKLLRVLSECIRKLKSHGFRHGDIILDVTGGQKTASIAAAIMTLHFDELVFQYVSTNEPHAVLTFNATGEQVQLTA